jgi:DNA-binding NarL/FixJ family response regulator
MEPSHDHGRAPTTHAPRVVLFVEDDALFSAALSRVLRARAAVLTARSVEDALVLVDKGGFDLLLTDYQLGARTSLPLLARAAERWPRARRVVLTSQLVANVEKLLPAGAADLVLEKSIDPQSLGRALGL